MEQLLEVSIHQDQSIELSFILWVYPVFQYRNILHGTQVLDRWEERRVFLAEGLE